MSNYSWKKINMIYPKRYDLVVKIFPKVSLIFFLNECELHEQLNVIPFYL